MATKRATVQQANELRSFARTGGAGDNVAANRLDMLYDLQFHDMVAAPAGNVYRLYHHAGQGAATKREHLAMARAIRNRDSDAAGAPVVTHLRTASDRLNAVFAGDALTADGASTEQD